jgi:excisionase family DNA binding protein
VLDEPKELLTVAEVADQLRVNQQTIRNWIDRGELAAIRVGPRRVRIRSSALEEFISQSSPMRAPTQEEAQEDYADAIAAVDAASGDVEKAAALRALAKTATRLARALSR